MKWGIPAMPSKTSWVNKELVLQINRNVGWISLVYFLGLFLALPLRILMLFTDERYLENVPFPIESLFQNDFPIQLGLMLVVPILMSVFLFRFLQVKQSADLMHSLPIKRKTIFHYYAVGGMIGLIFPIVLIAFVVMIIHGVLDLNTYFGIEDIFYWSISTILVNLLLFTAGTFVAMMTGISAVQGVLTYIFLLFPAGITLLVFYNLNILLFGFPSDYYLNRNLEKLSPLTYASFLDGRPLQWKGLAVYAVSSIILYGLALFFYKKRKVESASEAIAVSKLRLVFKYGVTFCTMLVGGMYFREMQENSFGWVIFGYALGAVLGYYIAEMLLQKTWRVFARIKGLAIYSVIIVFVVTGVKMLGVYENYVPEQEDIKEVLLSDTTSVNLDPDIYEHLFVPEPLKEKGNIEAVRQFHEQIIANKHMKLNPNEYYDTAFFQYELNNGDKVTRSYRIYRKDYEDVYESINETEEFKRATNEVFKVDPEELLQIQISANGPVEKSINITKMEDLKEMLEAIQKDILAESYVDREYFRERGSWIEIQFGKDRWIHMSFRPTFHELNKWLTEKGLIDQAKVVPEDVSYMQVVKWNAMKMEDPDARFEPSYIDPDYIVNEMEKVSDLLKVTDKEEIEELLSNTSPGGEYVHKYIVSLHYENEKYAEVLYIDEEHTPEFIQNYFQ